MTWWYIIQDFGSEHREVVMHWLGGAPLKIGVFLAALIVTLTGTSAFGMNSVVVQSDTVAPGGIDTVFVTIANDFEVCTIVMPSATAPRR